MTEEKQYCFLENREVRGQIVFLEMLLRRSEGFSLC